MTFWRKVWMSFTYRMVEKYVDPLEGETSIPDLHAQAILEDKQRTAFQRIRHQGKLALDGYKPPDMLAVDRVVVHAARLGILMPSERRKLLRSISSVRTDRTKSS